MGHARALIGKTPDNFDEKTLSFISSGKISVRDLEKNKRKVSNFEPNYISSILNTKDIKREKVQFLQNGHVLKFQKCLFIRNKSPCGVLPNIGELSKIYL